MLPHIPPECQNALTIFTMHLTHAYAQLSIKFLYADNDILCFKWHMMPRKLQSLVCHVDDEVGILVILNFHLHPSAGAAVHFAVIVRV